MKSTPKRRHAPLALPLLVALAGCLDFDEQDLSVAYDAKRDTLCVQLVYRGLCSGIIRGGWASSDTEDVEGTRRQLEEISTGKPIFALLWDMLPFDLSELRESDDPPVAALAQRILVQHGDFFRAEDGRLCGWQHLRILNVAESLAAADVLIHRELEQELKRPLLRKQEKPVAIAKALGCDDAESMALWRLAIAAKAPWFEESGSRILCHVPASASAAQALATRVANAPTLDVLLARLAKTKSASGSDATSAASTASTASTASAPPRREAIDVEGARIGSETGLCAALLHAFAVTVEPHEHFADLVLFDAERPLQSVRVSSPEPTKNPDLAPHLQKRRLPIRNDVTDATLAQLFAEFRAGR